MVASLETLQVPSADKRAQAVAGLVAAFAKDGKALDVSVANLAVEFALQKVRTVAAGVTAPTATTPASPATVAAAGALIGAAASGN